MGAQMAKVICEKTINGVSRVVNATTPMGNQGEYVISLVGPGNPFWLWPSIPSGRVIGASFEGAPICTDDPDQNNILIAQITAQPTDLDSNGQPLVVYAQ